MNKSNFLNQLQSTHAQLFGLSYALLGDQLEAAQLLIDALTVFSMSEKDFILGQEVDTPEKRSKFKRLLSIALAKQVFELAKSRVSEKIFTPKKDYEYGQFFEMNLLKRSVIYLKEKQGFSVEEIQEVFSLQRYEVIEALYNARYELSSREVELPKELSASFQLLLAYSNDTLKKSDQARVEASVFESEEMVDFYNRKQNLLAFYKDLIPVKKLSKKQKVNFLLQQKEIIDTIFPREKNSTIRKIKRFLDKPIITINY